jgi:hypothetical protein
MVCRHQKGDPNCSSSPGYAYGYSEGSQEVSRLKEELNSYKAMTGNDYGQYVIRQKHYDKGYLILRVEYPSCSKCAFEGNKVMVFKPQDPLDALGWRKIDPHFRDKVSGSNEAPAPLARFPASNEGWKHALAFVNMIANTRI